MVCGVVEGEVGGVVPVGGGGDAGGGMEGVEGPEGEVGVSLGDEFGVFVEAEVCGVPVFAGGAVGEELFGAGVCEVGFDFGY